MSSRMVVAIDGPGGAGKSTIARRLARRLGFLYIDTGAMYRAAALGARRRGVAWDDPAGMERLAESAEITLGSGASQVFLNGEEVTEAIRSPDISQGASMVSALSGVRRVMVDKQRRMAEAASVVMEGRDIGTVVFPRADVKIFLDADLAVRAERRRKELALTSPAPPPLEEVARELEERDRRDRSRADSPLARAPDAILLDTTPLSIEEVEQTILQIVNEKRGARTP